MLTRPAYRTRRLGVPDAAAPAASGGSPSRWPNLTCPLRERPLPLVELPLPLVELVETL
ncbi:hypothetical protein [Microterricola gilva]|uniref:hypothetical protein n=1 Tax=Microterricola gilva TaxID=393267 RepID=UPI0013EEB4BD|nr:hypothetical protein [Microterricola gilva]